MDWSTVGLEVLVNWLLDHLGGRTSATVLAHRAALSPTGETCVFVNVTNRSRDRAIEITHVGFDTDPPIEVINLERPLPRRLEPDESWETWLPMKRVPEGQRPGILTLGRVRFSDLTTIRTRENHHVPSRGYVPGP
jgi:hypothetical protein